jgi:hypothetical protein
VQAGEGRNLRQREAGDRFHSRDCATTLLIFFKPDLNT